MKQSDMTRQPLSRRQFLALLGMGAGGLLVQPLLSGCAVDPVTGRQEFVIMSRDEEIALDRKQSPYQFSSDYGPVQDRRLNSYINRVGLEVAAHSHRPDMPFSFRAVNAAYINAYAFPGGSIAATRGILVELNNEAELAALLGHEIGHVCARHTAEQSTKGLLANLLVAGAAIATSAAGYSDAAGLVQDLGGLGAGALLARYSRDNEREADALGMEYMVRTGYTPRGMVELMEILLRSGRHKASAIELMFATHPMSEERLRTAEERARGEYAAMLSRPDHRQRYMEHTAALRRIKPAIVAMQQAQKAFAGKKYHRAEELLNRALKIAPDDYAALVMMAKCQYAMQRKQKAERYALRAARVYPQEAQAHLVAGVIGIENRNYGRALQQLTEYDRRLPGNPEIIFLRGLALEGMQRRQEAARAYADFLRRVNRGPMARYAYNRLQTWGYVP